MKKILSKLESKQNLSFEESKSAFEILMDGKASDDEIFNFLTFLSLKGEVSDEIAGGVYVLRNKAKKVNSDGAKKPNRPQVDYNKEYKVPVGNSIVLGNPSAKVTITDKIKPDKLSDHGLIRCDISVNNQRNIKVMSLSANLMIERKGKTDE